MKYFTTLLFFFFISCGMVGSDKKKSADDETTVAENEEITAAEPAIKSKAKKAEKPKDNPKPKTDKPAKQKPSIPSTQTGTDTIKDSDDDGLSNEEEVNVYSTDPENSDSDNDGLKDGEEINTYLTDPLDEDTDNDTFLDGDEIALGENPTEGDTSNPYEIYFSSYPTGQNSCFNSLKKVECSTVGGKKAECGSPQSLDFCGQDAQYAQLIENRFKITISSKGNIIIDTRTGLIWQQTTFPDKSWQQTFDYCDNLSYGGKSDWRLPTYHELRTIINYGLHNPAIDITVFPNTPSANFWSSSTSAENENFAWFVDFNNGNVGFDAKEVTLNVRCTRDQ